MASLDHKYKLLRSKSFDASLAQFPRINNHPFAQQYIRHAPSENLDFSDKTNRSVLNNKVVIISRTPLFQQTPVQKQRRGSLKENDLIKSMLNNFNVYRLKRTDGVLGSAHTNTETPRVRHRSEHILQRSGSAFIERKRSVSASTSNRKSTDRCHSDSNMQQTKEGSVVMGARLEQHQSQRTSETNSLAKQNSDNEEKGQVVSSDEGLDPAVQESLDKCRRWVNGLPERFSGMHNAVSFPAIYTDLET